MGALNYGTLEDISNNQFAAKEQIIKISIFNIESSSFTYGVSVAYQTSKISSYTSSLFTYSIGLKKSYFDNRFLIGLSLENYNDVIKIFEKNSIETRPIISGNITKHPVIKDLNTKISNNLKNTNLIHDKGFLIGCHPGINMRSIKQLQKTFNELKNL